MKKYNYSQIVKIILGLLIILIMVRQLILKEWFFAFTCCYTIGLFALPRIFDKKFNIKFPVFMEIGIYLFIFASCILGEVGEYYIHVSWWDDLLHVTSGMLLTAISLYLVSVYDSRLTNFYLTNFLKVFLSFCLTITVLVLWECFEFSMDKIFLTDMQKDTVVKEIVSVSLNEKLVNKPVKIDIEQLYVNQENWLALYGGYIDIGLTDTMHDLFDGLIGSSIIAILSYHYYRKKELLNEI